MSRWTRARDGERGNILVMTALLTVPLLIFVGFSVDVGAWYSRASRLQRAADAAALAGVIWMPDFDKAEDVALETAKRNGFESGVDDITVRVSRDPTSNRRLRVAIEDDRAETYFASVVMDSIQIDRRAIGEYVLPVPLGSPANHFGTGDLVNRITGGQNEYFWAAVNGFCTDKVDGDRVLSRWFGNKVPSGATCPYTVGNTEYRPAGYTYYVDLPAGRASDVTLAIYDAAYYPGAPSGSPDLSLGSSSTIDTTFTLRRPDASPLDDSDNPRYDGCRSGEPNPRTFTTNQTGVFQAGLGAPGPERWTRFCTLDTSAPAGRYLLEVKTPPDQARSLGSNGYSLWAKLGAGNFCDGRTDPTCPRVYGKDDMSVFARSSGRTGEFFLTEIDKIHAGKQMLIRLWDPGEGGKDIQIIDPIGRTVPFTYSVDGGPFTTVEQTSLNVSGAAGTPDNYNGKSVELLVSLAGYDPPASNSWWKIKYSFNSGSVTDRTTWSVSIIGDPVHLVEER